METTRPRGDLRLLAVAFLRSVALRGTRWGIGVALILVSSVASAKGSPNWPVVPSPTAVGKGSPITTQLTEVLPNGSVRALVGADAWLLVGVAKPSKLDASFLTLARVRATTDSRGMLRFEGIRIEKGTEPADLRYRIHVSFQGVTTRSMDFSADSPPEALQIYHVTSRPDAISLSVHWTLEVAGEHVNVTQMVRVYNAGLMTVDYRHTGEGLRLPTLGHRVDGRIPVKGVFPKGVLLGAPQPSTGQGQLAGEEGAVVFRGPVPPGSPLFFQFRYSIVLGGGWWAGDEIHLGVVSELPLHDAALTFEHSTEIAPRIRLDIAHRAVRSLRDRVLRHDMLLGEGLPGGTLITFTVDRLPLHVTRRQSYTAAATFLGGCLLLALLMGRRRRLGTA